MTTSSICTRSIAAVVALSFAGFAAPSVSAQTTATTVPVGFITKTMPAAGASPTNTVLSVPLYQTADFQSAVASTPVAGSHAVTLTSAAFTAAQFTTTPHLLRVKTGALTGKFLVILSHDATTLNLKEPNGGVVGVPDANLTGLLAGDSCEILPANTLASTFGAIPGIQTASSAGGADNILVWNGTSYTTYFQHTTLQWRQGLNNANNVILFPDDAVFFVRKAASALPITVMGTVPSTGERTELSGASATTFVSNRFPVDVTLGTSGIETTTNWVKASSASGADNVLLWNGISFDTYFYHTTNQWRKGLNNATTTPIPAASGFFVVSDCGILGWSADSKPPIYALMLITLKYNRPLNPQPSTPSMKKYSILSIAAILSLSSSSVFAAALVMNFDSGGLLLQNNNGVALSGGQPLVEGDGAVIQVGYFSGATSNDNNFAGAWIPLTGRGSVSFVDGGPYDTTVGDNATGLDPINQFSISLVFDTTTNLAPTPAVGTILSIRVFDSTTVASGFFMTLSNNLWKWITPTTAQDPNSKIQMSFGDNGVLRAENRSGAGGLVSTPSGDVVNTAGGTVRTSVPVNPVPEPSSSLLALAGCLSFFARRRTK